MNNKTILITGSTDGIGKQTALELARMGAKVVVHGRNDIKANKASEDIIQASGNESIEAVSGDLASFASVRKMAENIQNRFSKIDVLINNAGVYKNNREISEDGFELTFAVNHLSYFLLTGLLLDLVMQAENGRIINVASMAHASSLDFENLKGEKIYDAYDAYSRSKLCNILFTFKLAKLLEGKGVSANCLHPGVISTKLLHAGWGSGGGSLSSGAKTSVFLATSPEVENISGNYFTNGRKASVATVANNHDIQNRLWEVSEELCGFRYPK